MRTTSTTFTCDRCEKSETYEHVPGGIAKGPDWAEEWACYWPGAVGTLNGVYRTFNEPLIVCQGCLTEEELESLTHQRLPHTDDIPY